MKYYLIGIKGSGMAALAKYLIDLGNDVLGSDTLEDFYTVPSLLDRNITIHVFDKNNINLNEKIIYIASSCYDYSNIEIKTLVDNNIPFYYYHDFIGLINCTNKIGVSGTHGKTTTTKMITEFLSDKKVGAIIGDGTGYGIKNHDFFIFEACEYRNHFHKYNFDYLVITNIDEDHLDFFKDINDIKESFQTAANKSKYLIINNDDVNCKQIKHQNKVTFGLTIDSDVYCKIKDKNKNGYELLVKYKNNTYIYFLPFLAHYMIYNFLASLTISYLIDPNIEINNKLIGFQRPKRRMEEYTYKTNIFIDDYAHHPTEISFCLEEIKQKYSDKKIVVIFQPHTYSRTISLKEKFMKIFDDVDELYLEKTFTSKREPKNNKLEKEIRLIFNNAKKFNKKELIKIKDYENSVIVFLGAGVVNKYIKFLLNQ